MCGEKKGSFCGPISSEDSRLNEIKKVYLLWDFPDLLICSCVCLRERESSLESERIIFLKLLNHGTPLLKFLALSKCSLECTLRNHGKILTFSEQESNVFSLVFQEYHPGSHLLGGLEASRIEATVPGWRSLQPRDLCCVANILRFAGCMIFMAVLNSAIIMLKQPWRYINIPINGHSLSAPSLN